MSTPVSIGPLEIPALSLRKGQLLHLHIPWPLDMDVDVPPGDITITPRITLLPKVTVYDPAWITGIVTAMIPAIAEGVFKLVEPYLDKLAEDFYHRRGK